MNYHANSTNNIKNRMKFLTPSSYDKVFNKTDALVSIFHKVLPYKIDILFNCIFDINSLQHYYVPMKRWILNIYYYSKYLFYTLCIIFFLFNNNLNNTLKSILDPNFYILFIAILIHLIKCKNPLVK